MARLVVVSNRVALPRKGEASAGGLAVALREALVKQGGIWFGWSGEVVREPGLEPTIVEDGNTVYATLDLSPADHDAFYVRYANGTLWPLCHYRLALIEFRRSALEGYRRVNKLFAAALAKMLQPDDVVWVHDYHFFPLGAELRKLGVENRIGFFLHIPFPAPELLTALPGHQRLVAEICAYNLVGMHTWRDVRSFCDYIIDEVGGHASENNVIKAFGRSPKVGAYPISIDTKNFARLAARNANSGQAKRLRESLGGRDLVIGVDRLDYSKGLPQRFEAFEELLEAWSEHRTKVTLLQVAPISRGEVAEYRRLRKELEWWAGRINGKYAEFDWQPIRYLNKTMPRPSLAAFYRMAKVGLVTPLRDGMNLVAKEYVASQDPENPGVLILSRFAGAAAELQTALIVNPYDVEAMATSLHQALKMPLEERKERWRAMMDVLEKNTIATWRENFLADLAA